MNIDKEQCRRKFFQTGVTHDRPLVEYMSLLNLCNDDIADMADKDIVLIGGGESDILGELENGGVPKSGWKYKYSHKNFDPVRPRSVTNIDPFARPIKGTEQDLIQESFTDFRVTPDFADRMLALFSLPHYAESVEEVKMFYAKACLGLAPRGKLNVFPITPRKDEVGIKRKWIGAFGEFSMELCGADPRVEIIDDSLLDQSCAPCIVMPDDKKKVNKFVLDYMKRIDMENAERVNGDFENTPIGRVHFGFSLAKNIL